MTTQRTFTVHAKEVRKENRSFITCSAEINGRWYKIKFTKECNQMPKVRGLYELTIDFDNCSLEKGKPYTNAQGKKGVENDTIWVKSVISLRQYTEEELNANNRAVMYEIFGTDEDIPY